MNGNGHASQHPFLDDAPPAVSTFWTRWGTPLTTAGSVALSLFLIWHQVDLSLRMHAAQLAALQAQIQAMQLTIDRLESRIYALTAEEGRARVK